MNICVMGIGNVLMGDDALGPWMIEALDARWKFPPEVALVDAGTPGLDLTLILDGLEALIAVDAIRVEGRPGSVHSYRGPDLLAARLPIVMSPHEPSLREALMRTQLLGRGPSDVLLVGAIPANISAGSPLSDAVRAAVPDIEARIVAELGRFGAAPARRAVPRVPNFWWERNPRCASASPAR